MRILLLILLATNLLLYAWPAGWLGHSGGEAERLKRQIDADSIRVLAPEEARKPLCRRIGGLDASQAQALQQWAGGRVGVQLDLLAVGVNEHMVLIPALLNAGAVGKKQTELRALGINEMRAIEGGDSGPFAIVLGVFRDEAAARKRLDELAARGVRSARVQTRVREDAESEARLRLRGAGAERQDTELGRWVSERSGLQLVADADCPSR